MKIIKLWIGMVLVIAATTAADAEIIQNLDFYDSLDLLEVDEEELQTMESIEGKHSQEGIR
jgi:hypothetical protein